MRVYLAGSIALLPDEGRAWRERAAAMFALIGIEVNCPVRHGAHPVRTSAVVDRTWAATIVKADVALINDSVALIVNGSVLSEGTMWEVGYAWTQRKPSIVFGYQDRIMSNGERRTFSPFFEHFATTFVNTLDEAVAEVKRLRDSDPVKLAAIEVMKDSMSESSG